MKERWHGTHGGYVNHHCRCTDCRAANAAWQRGYRQRNIQRGLCVDCTADAGPFRRCPKHAAARAAHWRATHPRVID